MNYMYNQETEAHVMDDQHGQALEMDAEFEQKQAAERKRVAMECRAERRARNQKRFKEAGTKTVEFGR